MLFLKVHWKINRWFFYFWIFTYNSLQGMFGYALKHPTKSSNQVSNIILSIGANFVLIFKRSRLIVHPQFLSTSQTTRTWLAWPSPASWVGIVCSRRCWSWVAQSSGDIPTFVALLIPSEPLIPFGQAEKPVRNSLSHSGSQTFLVRGPLRKIWWSAKEKILNYIEIRGPFQLISLTTNGPRSRLWK